MKLVGAKLSLIIRDSFDTSTWCKDFRFVSEKSFNIVRCYTTIASKADYPLPEFLKSYHPMFKDKI